ncbi:MAG: hypothetical protein LBG77_07455 [Dysgonamonadaceae bacterium]|jgi:hypothetical protein|nr:hypothetical protein [Dysgonamonadaceae bacterium]
MKRKIYQILFLLVWSVAGANAQVRIGSVNDPHPGAVLDLNADDTKPGSLGFLLPRVSLSNTTDWQLAGNNPVIGMMVYNFNSVIAEGLYVWAGSASGWVALAAQGNSTPAQPNVRPVKVMMLYTPAAKAWADQNGTIDVLIDKVLQQSNDVMSKAQAGIVFNLAYKQEVAYTESASSPNIDLNRLRKSNDGYLDEVQGLQTQYNADTVILLIDDVASGANASGYLLNDDSGNVQSSFSVVKISTI